MKQFQQKFIDEVNEMMNELEHNLLTFEKNPNDKNLIDSIFRSMHTLKGSGGMFGYDSIVELTHKVENIYAKIQNNEIKVSERIINLTFSATDLILRLLHDSKPEDTKLKKQYDKTIEELNDFFSKDELEVHSGEKDLNLKLFYIKFEPDIDVEDRGVNLKKIFKELNKLGKLKIIPKQTSDPGKYALNWEIFLSAEVDIDDIEEIMMFVDLECEIYKISDSNLLLNPDFNDKINNNADNEALYTEEEILEVVKQILPEEEVLENKEEELPDIEKVKRTTLRIDAEKLDDLMRRLSELITIKSEIKLVAKLHGYKKIKELVGKLEFVTSQIQKDIFDIRLVTLETIRVNLERLIRDTSISLKKETQFKTEGMDTELDKAVVEKLLTPLLHIIRNSIDHGIEPVGVRAERNKTAHGNIKLRAYQAASHVYIEISDDGDGINKEKILEKAITKGIIPPGEKLSDKEIYDLMFAPGLSTAVNLSEVSGRGVGMDVVRSEILKLRGDIIVDSERTKGTKITLRLPLSFSIIDTLLLQSGHMYFSIPIDEINQCSLTNQELINESSNNYIKVNSELIPYIYLREVFNIDGILPKSEKAIVVNNDNKQFAIIVDKVIGEFQAVLKPLGESFKKQDFLSGASLMADGNIAFILDTKKLNRMYSNN